jgi:hypothetical protein
VFILHRESGSAIAIIRPRQIHRLNDCTLVRGVSSLVILRRHASPVLSQVFSINAITQVDPPFLEILSK